MREIKFRAWNNECKVIREYDELKGLTLDALDASDFKLEQFTGLTDVNGEEIYEGDIVCADVSENTHFNYKVTFRNGEYIMVSPITNNTELCSWYQSELNVIGNIHENPELLEADD